MRRYIVMTLLLLLLMLVGCGNKPDANGSMVAKDGRSYGGYIEAKMEETVRTSFFDFEVKDIYKYNTYPVGNGLYQAKDGNVYVVVTVKIKNTYNKDITMSITDFVFDYDGKQEDLVITGFGKTELQNDDFMMDSFVLKEDEEIEKKILYCVSDQKQFRLRYTEYYEDQFEGNTFSVVLIPEVDS